MIPVTHGPDFSAVEVIHDKALHKFTFTLLTYFYYPVSVWLSRRGLQSTDIGDQRRFMAPCSSGNDFTYTISL